MTTQIYKQKRKNEDRRSVLVMMLQGLWAALRGTGKVFAWVLSQMWSATRWLLGKGWRGTGWLLRGMWRVTKGLLRYSWLALLWFLSKPWQFLRYLIYGRIPEFENAAQEEAFWRIKRRFGRRRFFLTHIFVYLFGMGFIWVDWLRLMQFSQTSPYNIIVPTQNYVVGSLFWTLLLIFHFLRLRIGDAEDEALGEVMQHGQAAQRVAGKRKRNPQHHAAEWNAIEQRLSGESASDDPLYERDSLQHTSANG